MNAVTGFPRRFPCASFLRSGGQSRSRNLLPRLNHAAHAPKSRCLHARATDYLPTNQPEWTESQRTVREAIAKIMVKYPDEYWAEKDEKHAFPWELYNELARDGWLGICLPEEYGGSALGISEAAVMLQTLSESGGGMNAASSVHMNIFGLEPVVKFGTEDQKRRHLPPLMQGKDRACFGVTEPNSGKCYETFHMKIYSTNLEHQVLILFACSPKLSEMAIIISYLARKYGHLQVKWRTRY